MSNLLYLSQVLPYPIDAGPKMREYYVLRQLSKHHDVRLLTFVRKEDPAGAIAHLADFCKEVIPVEMKRSSLRNLMALASSFVSRLPFLIARDRVPEMESAVREAVRVNSFEAIHADQLWMTPYALLAREAARQKGEEPRLVLDQHNSVYLIPERMAGDARNPLARWLLKREARQMRGFEVRTQQAADEMFLELYRNKIRFFRKHYGDLYAGAYKGILWLASVVRLTAFKLTRRIRASTTYTRSGLENQYSMLFKNLANL